MIRLSKIAYIWVLICLAPVYTYAQNFNNIFDIDSSNNIGNDIFLEQDGSFMILGDKLKHLNSFSAIKIAASGDAIVNNYEFSIDSASVYTGYVARKKKLPSGGFLTPFTVVWYRLLVNAESGGYAILDINGKVVEHHEYNNDTSNYVTEIFDCIQLPDGGYLCGGVSVKLSTFFSTAILIRTDDTGKLLWQKSYPYLGFQTHISSLQLIDANTILAGGSLDEQSVIKSNRVFWGRPRFLKLDINGNIVKGTAFIKDYAGIGKMGNGNIFKDNNGGYYHYGQLERIYDSSHIDWAENFPDYFMHLDDSFKIDWVTKFEDSPGHKYIWTVKQLRDNSYLVFSTTINDNGLLGWAAKVSKNGVVLWDQQYYHDSAGLNYLTDAIEQSDGSIVFTGYAADYSLPQWHAYDLWMLKVDANGCEIPGCIPTNVGKPIRTDDIKVYPNPVPDNVIIEGLSKGYTIQLMDMFGRHIYTGVADKENEAIDMVSLNPGNYIVVITENDGQRVIRKIMKQ